MTYRSPTDDLQMTYRWPTDDLHMTYRWSIEDYQNTNIENKYVHADPIASIDFWSCFKFQVTIFVKISQVELDTGDLLFCFHSKPSSCQYFQLFIRQHFSELLQDKNIADVHPFPNIFHKLDFEANCGEQRQAGLE